MWPAGADEPVRRAILLVLDSIGCGESADAAAYGDTGADTLGHIAEVCATGHADGAGLRHGPLTLPHLCALGLGSACHASTGRLPAGLTSALLERLADAGRAVVTVGKIGDIFAHRHTGEERHGAGNDANLDLALAALKTLPDGGLIFANLVDFDSEYGHRRDVAGYAACLEHFDRRLPALLDRLRPNDLLVLTADHGNDPTFRGTDHTREHVPILAQCAARGPMRIGRRESFADVGATIAAWLAIGATPHGQPW